jgi:hypothetical protein
LIASVAKQGNDPVCLHAILLAGRTGLCRGLCYHKPWKGRRSERGKRNCLIVSSFSV